LGLQRLRKIGMDIIKGSLVEKKNLIYLQEKTEQQKELAGKGRKVKTQKGRTKKHESNEEKERREKETERKVKTN